MKCYASKEAYELAVQDANYVLQKISYRSDGLSVIAYLYQPTATPAQKLPVIIYNRGSYVRGDAAPELVTMFHRLAREGFAIVAPMYRGSDGGEGKDEMGGDDLADLMNIVPVIPSLGGLDAAQLFLYGESRGGMMTFQALRDKFPANAAATFGAFTDLEAMITAAPKQTAPMVKTIWPDYENRKTEINQRRSAVLWADALTVPLFLMHGGADRSVSPGQSLALAARLQELGRPYQLFVFAGDNHLLANNQVERDLKAAMWFKKHLAPSK